MHFWLVVDVMIGPKCLLHLSLLGVLPVVCRTLCDPVACGRIDKHFMLPLLINSHVRLGKKMG